MPPTNSFIPATSFEWIKDVERMIQKSGGRTTSATLCTLLAIHREFKMKGSPEGLKISHKTTGKFWVERKTVARGLLRLEKAGVISFESRLGTSPTINLIYPPLSTSTNTKRIIKEKDNGQLYHLGQVGVPNGTGGCPKWDRSPVPNGTGIGSKGGKEGTKGGKEGTKEGTREGTREGMVGICV